MRKIEDTKLRKILQVQSEALVKIAGKTVKSAGEVEDQRVALEALQKSAQIAYQMRSTKSIKNEKNIATK